MVQSLGLATRWLAWRVGVDDRGQTTIEYILLGLLVAVGAVVAIFLLSNGIHANFSAATTCLNNTASGTSTSCTAT